MQNLLKHEKVLSGNVFLQLIIMKWKDLHGLCLDAWNNYFVKMDDINYLFGKRLVVPGLYTDGMFVKDFWPWVYFGVFKHFLF